MLLWSETECLEDFKMATSMRKVFKVTACFRLFSLSSRFSVHQFSNFSSSSVFRANTKYPQIVVSKDGATVICYHPEEKFPYEHTKPLPRKEDEMREGESALKIQLLDDYNSRYRPNGPTNQELMKMFYTTRHVWDPKPRKRRIKTSPPRDREGNL